MKSTRKITGMFLTALLLIPYVWIPFVQQFEPKALAGSLVNNNFSSDLEDAIDSGGTVFSDSYLTADTPLALALAVAMSGMTGDLTAQMAAAPDLDPIN